MIYYIATYIVGHDTIMSSSVMLLLLFFFFQAEDGIRDLTVTGVQTCALPILEALLRPDVVDRRHPELGMGRRDAVQRGAEVGMLLADRDDRVLPIATHHIEIGRASCRERV